MPLDDSTADIKSKSGALLDVIRTRPVRIEQMGRHFRIDPGSGVGHREDHMIAGWPAADGDTVSGPTELESVPDQVAEHLQNAVAIAARSRSSAICLKRCSDIASSCRSR